MAETVAGLVAAVTQEASFDVTDAQALVWLNRQWRSMLGRARAFRATISFGNTVAGTAFYEAFPGLKELYSLEVAGVPYGAARRPDEYSNAQGRLRWSYQGETGLFFADAQNAAVQGVTLIPTPTTSGLAITGFAAVLPSDLTNNSPGNDLLNTHLDGDRLEGLISGALAIGYGREGNTSLRDANMAIFDRETEELRREVRRRFRGPGPTDIRIGGYTA